METLFYLGVFLYLLANVVIHIIGILTTTPANQPESEGE
jgi:hypothetical protein